MLTDIPATAVGTDGVVVLQQEYSTHFTSMAKRISWDSITGERVQVEAIKLLSECGCPETAQSKAFQEKAFAKIVKDYGEEGYTVQKIRSRVSYCTDPSKYKITGNPTPSLARDSNLNQRWYWLQKWLDPNLANVMEVDKDFDVEILKSNEVLDEEDREKIVNVECGNEQPKRKASVAYEKYAKQTSKRQRKSELISPEKINQLSDTAHRAPS